MRHMNRTVNQSATQAARSIKGDPSPVERVMEGIEQRAKQYIRGAATLNGTATPPINVELSPRSTKRPPPAFAKEYGRIATRVWAEPNHWGEITWRVDQFRSHSHAAGEGRYRSFHLDDLNDAMRGLYRAQQWIRRAERRLRWKRWWW